MGSPVLVTGGAGFIGSNFVSQWVDVEGTPVVNLDKLTYAGNLGSLEGIWRDPRHEFVQGDIADRQMLESLFLKFQPRAVVHFAAESHVDRSIQSPDDFVHTNVNGTFSLLEEARAYWRDLPREKSDGFAFCTFLPMKSTVRSDPTIPPFSETTAYAPNSPYSASKAASDHLVRAYHHTYGLPALTTNCSNNYGPYQFPEKLIPLVILHAVSGKPIPVYGDGQNVRDWLFVTDHCEAIRRVLAEGRIGETYNIGGRSEKNNLDIVHTICSILDELRPDDPVMPHGELITFVKDRPGHDRRYAIDASKIERELGWQPRETFESGIRKTVNWYLENGDWVQGVMSGSYANGWLSNMLSRSAA